ncbi:hypothetical protein PYCC9005_005943 [Savitreella phatthalungensis]
MSSRLVFRGAGAKGARPLHPKDKIKYWNIAVGDTVRVITGPSKGKVGKVQEVLPSKNKIVVGGVNVVRKMLPLVVAQASGLESQRFEYAAPIHYSNVQLVGEIPVSSVDPTPDSPKRTVFVKRVARGRTFFNKERHLLTWRRWIPGEKVFLPWPRLGVSEASKREVEGVDTSAGDLKATTFIETLHTPPVPHEVADALRNKYSKHKWQKVGTPRYMARAAVQMGEKPSNVPEWADPEEAQVDGEFLDGSDAVVGRAETEEGSKGQTKTRKELWVDARLRGMDEATIDLLAAAMQSRLSVRDQDKAK